MELLKWALIALVISILAGAFGYTRLESGAAKIAKLLFFIFLVIFVVFFVLAILGGELLL